MTTATEPQATQQPPEKPIKLAAFIGIDWADASHAVCIQTAAESERRHEDSVLEHKPGAIAAWAAKLHERFGGQPVGVCLEQSRGPLIYALSAYPWIVLYPVNPHSLASYRKAFAPSRAKDDRGDARLLCDYLRLYQDRLRAWRAEDDITRRMRLLLEQREKLVDQRTAFVLQLMAALKGYFPQALDWAGDMTKPMAWAFLRKWTTLADLKAARKDTFLKFYHAHHVRRGDLVSDAHQQVQDAVELVRDPAIIETSREMVQSLCKLLQAIQPCIDQHSAQIKELFARHPERHLFDGLPGAGPVIAPRLLAAFGGDRTRFQSAKEISQLSGIAPVTERSGKSNWVHWRWAASAFLRQTFHEFASHSIGRSAWAKATYDEFRARGQNHHAAVRMLAYKWIRILYRCWMSGTPYDEVRYIAALRAHGSPIALKLQPKEA